jgi:hypothetical protein
MHGLKAYGSAQRVADVGLCCWWSCVQLQARGTDKGKRKKGDDGGRNEKRQRTQKRQAYD